MEGQRDRGFSKRLAFSLSLKGDDLNQAFANRRWMSRLPLIQSLLAQMKAGDPALSHDLLIRTLLAASAARCCARYSTRVYRKIEVLNHSPSDS